MMDCKVNDFKVQSEDPSQHLFQDCTEACMEVKKNVTNAKERNRNSSVNNAFSILRTLIPTEPKDRKMSKIETLRLAISYIRHLANIIRARTEGDYDGQVCQRYGCTFNEELLASSSQKHICTFCLTESRRNFHSMNDSVMKCEAIPALIAQANIAIADYQPMEKSEKYDPHLYDSPDPKPIEENWQHSTEVVVKREI